MNEIMKKIAYYILTLLLFISNGGMLIGSYNTDKGERDKEEKDNNNTKINILGGIQIAIVVGFLFIPFFTDKIEDNIEIVTMGSLGISAIILFIYEIFFPIQGNINYNIFSPWYSNYQFSSQSPFTIDSMKLFKLSYFILMIISLTYAENKVTSVLIVAAFGFFFQLLNNLILYLLNNKDVIPSIFMYLDEYMKNSNIDDKTKQGKFFEIMGILRLSVIFILSIIIAFHFKVKGKLKEFLGAFTLTFTFLISLWQLFIGDECILNRTFNKYNKSYTDNNEESKGSQMIIGSLQEILQAQGGTFFNIAVLLLAIFIEDKGTN